MFLLIAVRASVQLRHIKREHGSCCGGVVLLPLLTLKNKESRRMNQGFFLIVYDVFVFVVTIPGSDTVRCSQFFLVISKTTTIIVNERDLCVRWSFFWEVSLKVQSHFKV